MPPNFGFTFGQSPNFNAANTPVGGMVNGGKDQGRPPNAGDPGFFFYQNNPAYWNSMFAPDTNAPPSMPNPQSAPITPNYVQTQSVKNNDIAARLEQARQQVQQQMMQLNQRQQPNIHQAQRSKQQQVLQQILQQPQRQQMQQPQLNNPMQGFVPSPNAPPGAPTYGQSVNNAGRTLGYDYTPGSRAVTQGGVNYGQIPAGPSAAPGAMTAVGNAGGYSNIGGVPTFTPGTGAGGMYGGSGSASGGKVICTAYRALGWLPYTIWRADMQAARTYSDATRAGYLWWGTPLAKIIRRSPLVSVLVWPFAKAWATEMAYKMGAHPHGSVFGKLLEIVCVPACWLIGSALLRRTREVTA